MRFSGKHAIIVSALSVAVAAWAAVTISADNHNSAEPEKIFTVNSHPAAGNDFTTAAESTIDGVVSIKSYASPRANVYNNSPFDDPFFEFFFGSPRGGNRQPQQRQQPQQQQQTGLGSGVIISTDGYIVTNNHVIANADRLEVTLNDGRSMNAEVIGTDEATDLALLKIEAESLSPIPLGDSDNLKVGEWVLAVGNPFGLTSTVTAGIVSAKARSISSGQQRGQRMGIESYIQTDAAVNPGNSGGALVNLRGELVGINSAIYSQTGNYAGHSFAIPTSMVAKIASDLKKYGTVQRAVLGISYTELDANTAREKNITATNTGILVNEVMDRSAAKEAGIEAGDVIIAINDAPTHTSAQMLEQMSRFSPGDKIKIKYVRDNKEHTTQATLYNAQGSTNISQAASVTQLGCAFKKLSDETKRQLKISSGVQVTGLKEGKFSAAGIKDGFIILDINNARVNSTEDVEKIFNAIVKSSDSDHVMFITGLYPTGKRMYYAVDLAD